ncbi:MAG: RluA family pseudouridine synthase [Saprospiraceae bacterium]
MVAIKASDLEGGDEMFVHQSIECDPNQKPIRIDKFLIERLEKVSRNRVQNAIKAGCILVNGVGVKSSYKIRPKDLISVVLPSDPSENEDVLAENIALDIVYEDDDVLIINKPPGMVVHPGVGNYTGTLVNALKFYLKSGVPMPLLAGNGADRPGIVHRIDKDTSGLMIIAKNDYAMTHLAKQFFDHTINRTYLALVWGNPQPSNGTITGFIGRHEKDRMQMYNYSESDKGKLAITHYETLEDLYYVSVVKCKLETGRTHQIRVHMKTIGNVLFNDARYGGDQIVKGTVYSKYKQFVHNCFDICPRQALHAHTLEFLHPTKNERMFFTQDLPEDMSQVLAKWRDYVSK